MLIVSLCWVVGGFTTSFSFGESLDVDDQDQILDLIVENSEYCVEKRWGNQIFLKPDQIYPTDEGMFLRLNHFDLVRLPYLYSTEEGCYVFFK